MFGPNILANGYTDFFPVQMERLDVRRGLEVTVLIEDIVSWQKGFVRFADRLSAHEQRRCVMKRPAAAFVPIDKANEQGCFADTAMKLLHNLERFRDEARFENKVLGRVSGDRKFGRD